MTLIRPLRIPSLTRVCQGLGCGSSDDTNDLDLLDTYFYDLKNVAELYYLRMTVSRETLW